MSSEPIIPDWIVSPLPQNWIIYFLYYHYYFLMVEEVCVLRNVSAQSIWSYTAIQYPFCLDQNVLLCFKEFIWTLFQAFKHILNDLWLKIKQTQVKSHPSSNALGCQSSLSVCVFVWMFANSTEAANPHELKFWGMQMVLD